MSTLLDQPAATDATSSSARRLRTTIAAVRLSFVWLGVRKSLTVEQRSQAVESFGAEGAFLSAGKKLIDTRDPAFKAVSSVRSRLVSLWRAMTLPYPEPGIRLIRQDDIQVFTVQATTHKAEPDKAIERLDNRFASMKTAARDRLGSLYNESDYRGKDGAGSAPALRHSLH